MTMVEQFVEKALADEGSFVLHEENRYYYFIQSKIGNARFVYGKYGFSERFYVSIEESSCNNFKIIAIVADGVVYLVDSYFFYSWHDPMPGGAVGFYDKLRDMNENFEQTVFADFCENLEAVELDKGVVLGCKKEARGILLSFVPTLEPIKCAKMFNAQDLVDFLCGFSVAEIEGKNRLEKDMDDWAVKKSRHAKTNEYMTSHETAAEWELRMAAGLRSVDANFVTVEFEYGGKAATGKIDPVKLMNNLRDCDYFSDYDFATYSKGEELLKYLGVETYHYAENKLLCEHISKITYGRKVLYEKEGEA